MNRYSLWLYVTIAVALALGVLYTLPNFFGEAPAVQVSPARATLNMDNSALGRVEEALKKAGIAPTGTIFDPNSVRVRLVDPDTQLRAKDVIERTLNPDPANPSYTVALNLLPNSPRWLAAVNALPMYVGLDLRGGVHFLLQVDMHAALVKQLDSDAGDIRTQLRDKTVRYVGIAREGDRILVRFRDADTRANARGIIAERLPELQLADEGAGDDLRLVATVRPESQKRNQDLALKQNIQTLHNRINELGVAEPVIQQQGADRVVVELPGVQDTTKAKEILGRTATLEVRLVDEDAQRSGSTFNVDVFPERRRDGTVSNVPMKKQVILTGDRFTGAAATFDQNQQPAVSINLDSAGGRIMNEVTRENIGHLMAIVLFERGKGETISVATIRGQFSNRFQITGLFTPQETNTLSLLIRAGALAAPMEIVEERTVGPSLGADNIKKGFASTIYGFTALALFIMIYYSVFGVFSTLALCSNLLLLVALLSMLQATLTLPGIALLIFGSGPVRGFAVVHCLGILTSIFSSVVISRSMVNLAYGSRRKLERVAIGNTAWK